MKTQGRKTYRTMQGKEIDLDQLRVKNETTPAVGNIRVNARGDELGPGGTIIPKQVDPALEYNTSKPDSVKVSAPQQPITFLGTDEPEQPQAKTRKKQDKPEAAR